MSRYFLVTTISNSNGELQERKRLYEQAAKTNLDALQVSARITTMIEALGHHYGEFEANYAPAMGLEPVLFHHYVLDLTTGRARSSRNNEGQNPYTLITLRAYDPHQPQLGSRDYRYLFDVKIPANDFNFSSDLEEVLDAQQRQSALFDIITPNGALGEHRCELYVVRFILEQPLEPARIGQRYRDQRTPPISGR